MRLSQSHVHCTQTGFGGYGFTQRKEPTPCGDGSVSRDVPGLSTGSILLLRLW